MADNELSRIKAGLLISILIRAAVLMALPELLTGFINNLISLWHYVNSAGPYPASLSSSLVWLSEAGLVLTLGLVVVFALAGRVGNWICGDEAEFVFSADLGPWQELILQFMGIVMIINGLSSAGSVIYEYAKTDQLNEINGIKDYVSLDPKIWTSGVRVGVFVAAGVALIAFPAPLARRMGGRAEPKGPGIKVT